MFKVKVRKQVHGCFAGSSSRDVYLKREFVLPFVPYIGLYISDGEWSSRIIEISWRHDEQRFVAYVEEDKEIYDAQLHRTTHRPLAEIVSEYVDMGWEVDTTRSS